MTDHTTDALASALPAGISYPADDSKAGKAFTARWDTREVARFQAEKLAETGYVLLHIAPDEATVHWLAKSIEALRGTVIDGRVANMPPRYMAVPIVRIVLAALAGTSAQARHTADDTTGGGA